MSELRLNIPLTGVRESRAVNRLLRSGFLTQGPKTAEFESAIADYVGVKYAFAVSSATTGLHLALVSLGVSAGDEVVIPDFSFPATANVVEQLGAVPKFVDIDPRTYNLDSEKLLAAISPKTKVIMPVHAFGLCADMGTILSVAESQGVPVLEDAACALGATVGEAQAGSIGNVGVFSFHPRKIITTGEGGMITTNDPEIAKRIAVLRSHGGIRGELYMDFVEAGFNYRLSDVHAAIGLAQMSKLGKITARRRLLADHFRRILSNIEEIQLPEVPVGSNHAFQSFVVTLAPEIDRDQVIREMKTLGIETTLGTYALHLQPYYRAKYKLEDREFPNATRAHTHGLTLPLYPQLKILDLRAIASALRIALVRSRRAG